MFIKHSYDSHFVNLLQTLQKKYGEDMFKLEGIDQDNLDISKFTQKFLDASTPTADKSIDGNANVDDQSILNWEYEFPKPLMKLNGLYTLWKDALSKHGIKRANKMIEAEINGAIRIHDLHAFLKPYSYYKETPIVIRINKGNPLYITMKQLFDYYGEYVNILPDREVIDLTNVGKRVGYNNVKVCVECNNKQQRSRSKFNEDNSFAYVFEKHNIEILDGDGHWTELKQVLRHKNDRKMVAYQLENGDFSLVTDNHPVILQDGSEKEAINLTTDDYIKLGDKNYFNNINEYINVDSDVAYLIGFITGDGNVGRHKFYNDNNNLLNTDIAVVFTKFENSITIYQKDIVNTKIYNVCSKLFGSDLIRKSVKPSGDRLSFSNKALKLLLSKYFNLDYQNSSYSKTTPINILSWDKQSKLAYIAGLIDSDGQIDTNGLFTIRMKAYSLINQLHEVLLSIGITSHKRIAGDNFEGLVGISFRDLEKQFIKLSTKAENYSFGEYYENQDRIHRTNKISKITVFDPKDIKQPFNIEDGMFDYVYDITTGSSTFYCGGMTQHNCWASSLQFIVNEGMPWVKKIKVGPIQHFDTFVNNSFQYVCELSTQLAGACALPDFFPYAEYFIRKDFGNEWDQKPEVVENIKQQFQKFIYSVNQKFRGNQSPFTNLTVADKYWLKGLFGKHTNPDFSNPDFDNLMKVQKLFVEVMVENLKDNPFTFPVMTAAQLIDKETGEVMDKDWLNWVADITVQNALFNIYSSSSIDSLSSCCRLRNQLQPAGLKDKEYTNSFGVGGTNIGSHRVVAINLPQIAYMAKYSEKETWSHFWNILRSRISLSQDILDIHKERLINQIHNGLIPLYKYGCIDINKQYSTLGFIGLYECLEIMGLDITTEEGIKKGKEILDVFNKMNDKRTEIDGHIRNVEQIPGEAAAVTFAKKDALQFAMANYAMYSNQYIPLTKEVPIVYRIYVHGQYDSDVGGGSILHLDVDQELTKEQVIDLIQFAAKNGVIYFAIDNPFSQCKNCGKVFIGKYDKSPCHQADTRKYMRVVGFRTDVAGWNKERRIEFKNRYCYHDFELN